MGEYRGSKSGATAQIVYGMVETLEEGIAVDEVEPRASIDPAICNDEIDAARLPSYDCVELNHHAPKGQ